MSGYSDSPFDITDALPEINRFSDHRPVVRLAIKSANVQGRSKSVAREESFSNFFPNTRTYTLFSSSLKIDHARLGALKLRVMCKVILVLGVRPVNQVRYNDWKGNTMYCLKGAKAQN